MAGPRTTDPVKLLRERDIAIRYPRGEIECLERELIDRGAFIAEPTQELAAISRL